jgi:hypothetical protein
MELLNNGGLQQGDVIIWDEAGVDISNRNWYTETNKAISFVIQTFRHRNLIVFFTTPSSRYIDSHLRILFNSVIETRRIDRRNKIAHVRYMRIEHNPILNKTYHKYLSFRNERGAILPLKDIGIRHPPMSLVEEYERKKVEFTKQLNEESEQEIQLDLDKRMGVFNKPKDLTDIIEKVTSSPEIYTKTRKNGKKYIDWHLIKAEGYGVHTSQTVKAVCERNLGYR